MKPARMRYLLKKISAGKEDLPMKAAVLRSFGSPLAIETVPDPVLGTGEVIVDVMASRVLAYADRKSVV